MTMASVAKITTPVLLTGKSMRTLGLRSFHGPIMSPSREILSFPDEPLV
jgi:hypothetical protein